MNRIALAFAATVAVSMLAGCAGPHSGPLAEAGPAVATPPPTYRVGDRWVYRVRDGYRNAQVYQETHAVTAVAADGITVDVTVTGPGQPVRRIEKWLDGGRVTQASLFDIETRRFHEPLDRYRFPMTPGASWNQRVGNYNEMTQRDGPINRHVRVDGYERITTSAGTFDTVKLRVIMRLDDEDVWRWPTDCTYTVWYAPAAKASVREVRRADYLEKGGKDSIGRLPSQYAFIELVSFTPGG